MRIMYFIVLILGAGLITFLANISKSDQTKASFVPVLKIAGMVPQTMSRTVSKVLPVNSLDEAEFGKKINENLRAESRNGSNARIEFYLSRLMAELAQYKKKPFDYQIHILDSDVPNAMAMPGGVIMVTKGLLSTIKSEGELVAILAHEMGHVELSHCFDSVKYEMLTRKMSLHNLGSIADFTRRLFIHHSFSKNQEDEADEYGFNLLKFSKYDPASLAKSFKSLDVANQNKSHSSPNPFRDYFMSHPPLDQRISKFSGLANAWWENNPKELRYVGKRNLEESICLSDRDFGADERRVGFSE